jgi:adenine-specific DNA-methyltransferase
LINTYFKQFPIPTATSAQQLEIDALVGKILALKKEDPEADVSDIEAIIDRMVYELYGLTEEEIKIVEGATK